MSLTRLTLSAATRRRESFLFNFILAKFTIENETDRETDRYCNIADKPCCLK